MTVLENCAHNSIHNNLKRTEVTVYFQLTLLPLLNFFLHLGDKNKQSIVLEIFIHTASILFLIKSEGKTQKM